MATLDFRRSLEKLISSEITKALPSCDRDVLASIKTIVNGGRKFRAMLFYNASKCFGYENEEDLLIIAAALETLHRASLIHDDLADQSSIRRGVKTLHIEHGNTVAIYIPTLLRDYTKKMLAKYPLIKKDLMKVYNELCIGQLYESQISRLDEINWQNYEKIVELKSAGLGRFALKTAYYLAHNCIDEENPRNIAKTGAILFQIVDDIEDLLDTQQNISTDIQNGIKPAPWFFLLPNQKVNLYSSEDVQRALSQPGVLKRTYATAIEYLKQLNNKIRKWLPDNEHKTKILDDITFRFNKRTRKYAEMRNIW